MSNVQGAFLAALALYIILVVNFICGYAQLIRPIVVGTVVGLFLGDIATGAMIGASLELINLGIVNVGGSQATDPCLATVIAVALAVIYGVSQETAVTVSIPIGYIGLILLNIEYLFNTFIMPKIAKLLDDDREKAYCSILLVIQYATQIMYAVVVFIAIAAGGDVITNVINSLPEFITTGIDAVGAMLPAIGMAMLINLMWSTKMCIYFFFGFIVSIYFGIPVLALAFISVFIAYLVITLKPKNNNKISKEVISEEEGFFS